MICLCDDKVKDLTVDLEVARVLLDKNSIEAAILLQEIIQELKRINDYPERTAVDFDKKPPNRYNLQSSKDQLVHYVSKHTSNS